MLMLLLLLSLFGWCYYSGAAFGWLGLLLWVVVMVHVDVVI